jgi:hypothetical protein
VDQLVDLLVVALHDLQQLAQVRPRLPDQFGHLDRGHKDC